MKKMKFLLSLVLVISVLLVQVGGVFASPASRDPALISGIVKSITLETDPSTGITTVLVEVLGGDENSQTVRVSQQTGEELGLLTLDVDGNPLINNLALGKPIDIDPAKVIPDQQENRHPIANALETFFSDSIPGLDYQAIMDAHDEGAGFGVIAQALWLTMQTNGNADFFRALIIAKQNNNYSAFDGYTLPDGNAPMNWGQLRKAILNGDMNHSLGDVMSNKDNHANRSNQDQNQNKDNNKDKSKSNNGNGGGNGNGNGNGNNK